MAPVLAWTKRRTPKFFAASRTFSVPIRFTSAMRLGSRASRSGPAVMADMWTTRSIFWFENTSSSADRSVTSPCMHRTFGKSIGGGRRSKISTSSPRSRSCSATFRPTKPAPPLSRIIPAPRRWPGSFLVAEDPGGERARVARRGAALVDQHEELEQRPVERLGLLDVDGVAGARQHHQAGVRDAALHEQRGLEAGVVLVAGDDERRDADPLHILDQLVEGRAAHLHTAHGERLAFRGVVGELPGELGPAARVLVLELHARRAEGILLRRLDPIRFKRSGGGLALGAELVLLFGLGAVAAAGDDERARALHFGI